MISSAENAKLTLNSLEQFRNRPLNFNDEKALLWKNLLP